MTITPPRLELFEESKAATASLVEGAVVIVRHEIEPPVLTGPLAPRDRKALALESCQNRARRDELIRLLPESRIDGDVVMFVGSFRDRDESGG